MRTGGLCFRNANYTSGLDPRSRTGGGAPLVIMQRQMPIRVHKCLSD